MNNKNSVAGVVVEKSAYSFDRVFDYTIPDDMQDSIQIGCRVLVPFGRASKQRQGVVVTLHNNKNSKLKEINKLLDTTPVVTQEMLDTAKFMKEHYFCTYYDAVKAMLPAGINYKITTLYSAVKTEETAPLNTYEQQIYDYLLKSKEPVKEDKILADLGFADKSYIDSLLLKGLLRKSEEAFRKTGDAMLKMVAIMEDADVNSVSLTPKQQSVFEVLETAGAVSVKEICYYTGVTQSVVDSIVKKGLAYYYEDEIFRTPKANVTETVEPLVITEEQNNAYKDLYSKIKED